MADETKKQEVTGADVYALRAFLDAHFSNNEEYQAKIDIWYPKCYIFSWLQRSAGKAEFSMRKLNHIFSFYDVLNFRYSSGRIEAQKGELRTEQDHEAVKGLVALLEQTMYGKLVSNLDDLKK